MKPSFWINLDRNEHRWAPEILFLHTHTPTHTLTRYNTKGCYFLKTVEEIG